MDGNTAAAHVAYAYTDVAAIYPVSYTHLDVYKRQPLSPVKVLPVEGNDFLYLVLPVRFKND